MLAQLYSPGPRVVSTPMAAVELYAVPQVEPLAESLGSQSQVLSSPLVPLSVLSSFLYFFPSFLFCLDFGLPTDDSIRKNLEV